MGEHLRGGIGWVLRCPSNISCCETVKIHSVFGDGGTVICERLIHRRGFSDLIKVNRQIERAGWKLRRGGRDGQFCSTPRICVSRAGLTALTKGSQLHAIQVCFLRMALLRHATPGQLLWCFRPQIPSTGWCCSPL